MIFCTTGDVYADYLTDIYNNFNTLVEDNFRVGEGSSVLKALGGLPGSGCYYSRSEHIYAVPAMTSLVLKGWG